MQVTFQDVHHYGAISQITDTYYINHFPEILDMYDGNFLTFRINPDLPTLKAAEEALRRFHQQNQQDHLKFVFPVDTQLKSDCRNYLETQGYSFSVTELYQITPKDFRGETAENIEVQWVNQQNQADFLRELYQEALPFGAGFAERKRDMVASQIDQPPYRQLLAYYKGQPAGFVQLIEGKSTTEIDNLCTLPAFRKRGVATAIQQKVMTAYPEQTVLLVADGEDTPRKMYQKQGYQLRGFQIEALKMTD